MIRQTTMIRNNHLFAALCLLAGGLASCSSHIDDELPANNTWTLNVKASKSDTPATRALSYDGTKITATWKTNETVDVRAYLQLVSRGTLLAQSEGATAVLKGTIGVPEGVSGYTVGDVLSLWFPDYPGATISYSGQLGTLADIAARFDYAHANVTVKTVDASNHVLTTDDATFVNAQAIVKFTLTCNNSPLSVSTLNVYKESVSDENKIASATLTPANSVVWMAIPPVSGQTIILTANDGTYNYNYSKASVTFGASHFYPITVKMTKE